MLIRPELLKRVFSGSHETVVFCGVLTTGRLSQLWREKQENVETII